LDRIVRRRLIITTEKEEASTQSFSRRSKEANTTGATKEVGGVSSRLLRYIEILLISPWQVELSEENGYALSPKRTVQIANPASFLAQKILIHPQRDYKDRAKDLLYMHDTIEVFSECLDELQKLFWDDVAPKLHARRVAELEAAPAALFRKVDDTIREASLMAADESSLRRDWLRQRKRG
jgi:hypothetical protein